MTRPASGDNRRFQSGNGEPRPEREIETKESLMQMNAAPIFCARVSAILENSRVSQTAPRISKCNDAAIPFDFRIGKDQFQN